MTRAISKHELIRVVDEIFSCMAGMKLIADFAVALPVGRRESIVSAVQIAGDWQGAVRLDVDPELAREVCSRFLGLEAAQLSSDDIRDGAAELANMMGGSIKALLAPSCSLSLPSIVMGRDYEFSIFHGRVVQQSWFVHESGRLLVSVIEKQGCN